MEGVAILAQVRHLCLGTCAAPLHRKGGAGVTWSCTLREDLVPFQAVLEPRFFYQAAQLTFSGTGPLRKTPATPARSATPVSESGLLRTGALMSSFMEKGSAV